MKLVGKYSFSFLLVFAVFMANGQATEENVKELADADAFCIYNTGEADAEVARLLGPNLIGTFGFVHGTAFSFGEGNVGTRRGRLTLGLEYSLSQFWRGLSTHRLAQAQCSRYRVISALRAFVQTDSKTISRAALQARLRVLENALPQAESILRSTEIRMRNGSATAIDLNATTLRVDSMRSLVAQTRQDLNSLDDTVKTAAPSVPDLLAAHVKEEEGVASLESSVRRTHFWDITLSGGYERIFGIKDRIPFSAMVTASFNLGEFFQGPMENRALEGRRQWVSKESAGVDERARQTLRELRATLSADRMRLQETQVLLADLQGRISTVEQVSSDHLASYRDYLWFDLIKVQSDQAYYQAHVADLAKVVELVADGG